jgi:hypothetical protein
MSFPPRLVNERPIRDCRKGAAGGRSREESITSSAANLLGSPPTNNRRFVVAYTF